MSRSVIKHIRGRWGICSSRIKERGGGQGQMTFEEIASAIIEWEDQAARVGNGTDRRSLANLAVEGRLALREHRINDRAIRKLLERVRVQKEERRITAKYDQLTELLSS